MSQYFLDNVTFENDTFDLHDTEARQLIANNTQNITALSARVTQNANDIDALEETTAELREDLDSVEDRVTVNEGEIDALKTRTTSLEGRMNSAETRLDGHDTDIASLQNRMTAAEGDIDLLETRMLDAETDIDALEDRMDGVEQKNTEQDAAIDDLDDRVTQNTADIVDIKDDIEDIQEDIQDLDDRITASTYEAGIGIYFGQGAEHTNINVEDELLDQINQNTLDIEILKNAAKLPVGGSAGQVLKKRSATDYDTQWADDLHTDYENITGARSGFTAPNTQRNFSLSLDNVQDAGHFWNDIQYLVPFQCSKAVVDVRPTTGAHTTITEGRVKTTLKTHSSPAEVGSIRVEEILIGNIGNISIGDGVSDPHVITFTLGLSASEKALLNTLLSYISSFDGKTTIGVPVLSNNAYVVDIEFDFVINSGVLRVRGVIPKAFIDPTVTGDYYAAAVFSLDYDIANDTTSFNYKYIENSGGGGGGASALNDLTDVTITSPAAGQKLAYNGTAWVNDNGNIPVYTSSNISSFVAPTGTAKFIIDNVAYTDLPTAARAYMPIEVSTAVIGHYVAEVEQTVENGVIQKRVVFYEPNNNDQDHYRFERARFKWDNTESIWVCESVCAATITTASSGMVVNYGGYFYLINEGMTNDVIVTPYAENTIEIYAMLQDVQSFKPVQRIPCGIEDGWVVQPNPDTGNDCLTIYANFIYSGSGGTFKTCNLEFDGLSEGARTLLVINSTIKTISAT